MTEPVLSLRNLRVEFATRHSVLRAIDGGCPIDIAKGEVLGVVGESGAGKSVTGLAVIGLIDPPGALPAARFICRACGSTTCRARRCAGSGESGSG